MLLTIALDVATEDGLEATTYLLRKQLEGLNQSPPANLRFIIGDILSQAEIIDKIKAELEKAPVDLVVIDNFGDVFTGTDTNNNMAMRNTAKTFDVIAKTYGCQVLFVHHVNKGAYKLSPGTRNIFKVVRGLIKIPVSLFSYHWVLIIFATSLLLKETTQGPTSKQTL